MNRRNFIKVSLGSIGLAFVNPAKLLSVEKKCKYLKPGIYMKEKDVSHVYQSKETFDRINKRRILMMIRENIQEVCSQFLYRPNDKYTRNALKNILEEYFEYLKMRKCIWKSCVICDETNNTSLIIDDRKLIVDMIIQFPGMSCGEEIRIHTVVSSVGANSSEVIEGVKV